MSGRESNARRKKKKLSRPRRLLGDIVLSLKPPYSFFFFFKCRSFIILNDVLVMRASMGLEDSTEASGIVSS